MLANVLQFASISGVNSSGSNILAAFSSSLYSIANPNSIIGSSNV